MPNIFRSDRQQQIFDAVIRGVDGLGYGGRLCQRGYEFSDWFGGSQERIQVPAATFARHPADYDSACLAVFLEDGNGPPLRYRSLGAPFGIEVREDEIIPWTIGHNEQTTRQPVGRIPAEAMDRFFAAIQTKWRPADILRAKNIGTGATMAEIDWIDQGLIPALEGEISRKLEGLLSRALSAGQTTFRRETGSKPDAEELYRVVFRLLAGKVFHDRKVGDFKHLDANQNAREVLRAVCDYYDEPNNYLSNREAQQAVAAELWTGLSFQNLSVDALALVYENTLVDDQLRRDNGIHSTPRLIARYIVDRLPFEAIPEQDRFVVEPCSGHGVFLVAALKRLRDLLDPDWDARRRHRYFADRLLGFEIDPFAREVSKLCLTLADFPNPNGWKLEKADVFASRKLNDELRSARIVLCNPPFEEFSKSERAQYGSSVGALKPLEVLKRVLRHSAPESCLGFVLPRTMLDGQSYREIRGDLARRYGRLELVTLPDQKIFRHADVETILMIASGASKGTVHVHLGEVTKASLPRFFENGSFARDDSSDFSADSAERTGLHVPELQAIWDHLAGLPKLESIVEMHRGVEWVPPFDEARYISLKERKGWWKGLRNVQEGFDTFSPPSFCWLNPAPEFRRRNAWDLDWSKPKVIVNAATKARGSWRLAAAFDESGLVCTQRYHCLWPSNGWGAKALSALLNSPLVSAFVATREGKRDVRKQTLQACPIPRLTPSQMVTLNGLVDSYMAVMNQDATSRLELWGGGGWEDQARRILLEMDALILQGYGLPPWLERRLLDFFRGGTRPVPFEFGDYYPADFAPNIPLRLMISQQFRSSTAAKMAAHLPGLKDEALTIALEEVG